MDTATKHDSQLVKLAETAVDMGLSLDDVVVVFACDDLFVPYLTVTLQSIIEHVDAARHYDIVILTRDISNANLTMLSEQATRDNMAIGFLHVESALKAVKLYRHGHFRIEMYFRLLMPSLLPMVDKAVYLDSDLIVLEDVAKLFDTDVSGHLLAATRDADTIGQALGYDETVASYLASEVGLDSPLHYLQSGVLVLNLAEFRRSCDSSNLIAIAASRKWRWPDQDVLNKVAHGSYVRLDTSWNALMDWQHLRRAHIVEQAPADIRADYDAAHAHPHIYHYAGPDDRPWLYPRCDRADLFWEYARRSPAIGEIERRLRNSHRTPAGLLKRLQVFVLFKGIMPAFDALFPPKTRRRVFIIKMYQNLGGKYI